MVRMIAATLCTAVLLAVASVARAGPGQEVLTLASGGSTAYTIVTRSTPTKPESSAAQELALHLKQITGADFPIKTESDPVTGPRIFIGKAGLRAYKAEPAPADLGPEELVVRTLGTDLVLTGGHPRGSLYAVYSFLEDDLGCRWWTPDASTIPSKPILQIRRIGRRDKPSFEYRNAGYYGFKSDRMYAVRNRANAIAGGDSMFVGWPGGKVVFAGDSAHSFATLAPATELMTLHPDWYSQGTAPERFQQTGQLCLTAPGLSEHVTSKVRALLQSRPEATLVSISQNDNTNYCKCARCSELAKAIGQSGILIRFVNGIAGKLAREFPLVIFHTLAYQYTRKPPLDVTAKTAPNVAVQITTEGPSRSKRLEDSEFAPLLQSWSRVCRRIYIWNYECNTAYSLAPMPNLHTMGPNYLWLMENGVMGTRAQGVFHIAGEFSELRGWIAAKLMWNPKADVAGLIDQFLAGYYSKAAPILRTYIEMLHSRTAADNWTLDADVASLPSLDWRLVLEAQRLFDLAESAVADDPVSLLRVRKARMQVDYMVMLRGKDYAAQSAAAGDPWPLNYSRDARASAFFATAEATGLSAICAAIDAKGYRTLGSDAGTWQQLRSAWPSAAGAR